LQLVLFAVFPNPRRFSVSQELPSTQFEAKIHSFSGVENRPISSRNHVFCRTQKWQEDNLPDVFYQAIGLYRHRISIHWVILLENTLAKLS
jgi:hypothetical protein